MTSTQKRKDTSKVSNQTAPTCKWVTVEDFLEEISSNDCDIKIDRKEEQIRKKYKSRIRRKIESGSYPSDTVDENNLPTLLRFVWKGKLKKLNKYLSITEKHQKINRTDYQGRTALHYASSWACVSTVKELLKVPNININAQDEDFKTPLFKAVEIGDLPTIEALVTGGANIGISSKDGRDAFEYALQVHGDNYLNIIKYLYQEIKMQKVRREVEQLSYLHLLCLTKKNVEVTKVMQYLISEGELVNATEGKGRTPLILAAQRNQVKLVKILLHHSADAKHIDSSLKSALRYAGVNTNCYKILYQHLQTLQRLGAKAKIPQENKVTSFVTSSTQNKKSKKTINTGYITRLF